LAFCPEIQWAGSVNCLLPICDLNGYRNPVLCVVPGLDTREVRRQLLKIYLGEGKPRVAPI